MFRTTFISLQGPLRCTYASALRQLQKKQNYICITAAANKRFLHSNQNYGSNKAENSNCCDNLLWRQGSGSAVHPLVFTQLRGLHTSARQHKVNKTRSKNSKSKVAKSAKFKKQRNSLSAINKGKNNNKKKTQTRKGRKTSALKSTVGNKTHKKRKHFSTSNSLGRKTALPIKRNKLTKKSVSHPKKTRSNKKQLTSQLPSFSHSTKHATKATSTHHRRQHSQLHKGTKGKHHINKETHRHNLFASSFASQRKHHHVGRPKQSAARRFVKKVAKSFRHAIGTDENFS